MECVMTGAITLLTAFFGATESVAKLFPKFSEKQKKKIEKECSYHAKLKKEFNKMALEFDIGSNSDELLEVGDLVKAQKEKIQSLYRLYAKELSS